MKRAFIASALLLAASLSVGCQSNGGCNNGQCGLLGGACGDACGVGCGAGEEPIGANKEFVRNRGRSGPLAGLVGHRRRGSQSHMGQVPGPAQGDPTPTYGYPYYTTRGPRDFLNPNPPNIGP